MMGPGGHTGPMPVSGDRKALILSGLLTDAYFVIELGGGWWSGSIPVQAEEECLSGEEWAEAIDITR